MNPEINMVLTQYILDAMIIVSAAGIAYGVKKKNKSVTIMLSIWLIVTIIASLVIHFDFTGANERVRTESNNANQIFQSKMKEPEKKVQEFNYKKDFAAESKDITDEADSIHKNIKNTKENK